MTFETKAKLRRAQIEVNSRLYREPAMDLTKLTDGQLKDIAWELRYSSDAKAVDKRNAVVEELIERGYPELD